MKRTREEINEAIQILVNRLGDLPDETILNLTGFLPTPDLLHLCQTDTRFAQFCQRFDLVTQRSFEELGRVSPVAVLLDTPVKQLDAIRRGQRTLYMVHLLYIPEHWNGHPVYNSHIEQDYEYVTGIHHISMDYDLRHLTDSIFVPLNGSPLRQGTKAWIFGAIVLVSWDGGLKPYNDGPGQWRILTDPNDPLFGWSPEYHPEDDPLGVINDFIEFRERDPIIREMDRNSDLYRQHVRMVNETIALTLRRVHEQTIQQKGVRIHHIRPRNDPSNDDHLLLVLQEVVFP